jgi:hypothetical protein
MFETARALVSASIKTQRPELSENELGAELFKRFCASDFNAEQLASIVARLKTGERRSMRRRVSALTRDHALWLT